MANQTPADDGTATTNYPNADDVSPVSTRDAQSITASGSYRDLLDAALVDMGDSDLADADPDAARRVRDSAKTVLNVESVAEAEAVAEAATYVLNGGPKGRARDDELTKAQEGALWRVKTEAERLAVAFTPAAHGIDTDHDDGDDDRARVMADGGTVEVRPVMFDGFDGGADGDSDGADDGVTHVDPSEAQTTQPRTPSTGGDHDATGDVFSERYTIGDDDGPSRDAFDTGCNGTVLNTNGDIERGPAVLRHFHREIVSLDSVRHAAAHYYGDGRMKLDIWTTGDAPTGSLGAFTQSELAGCIARHGFEIEATDSEVPTVKGSLNIETTPVGDGMEWSL